MVEAKHEFIDDNPYLVYSPDAEATASGSGGGAGFPIIGFDAETGALSVTAGELTEMLGNSPVMAKTDIDGDLSWYLFTRHFNPAGGAYSFNAMCISNGAATILEWRTETADDYPTPYQG